MRFFVDLKTMEEKLEAEKYTSVEEFCREMQLIFDNCRTYNNETTQYYKCADRLQEYFRSRLAARQSLKVTSPDQP